MLLDLLVDDVDPLVLLLVALGPLEEGVELFHGGDTHAEVVEARGPHRLVIGDEEDELVDPVGHQDQPLAVDRLGRQLLPAEDLGVEVDDVPAARPRPGRRGACSSPRG